MAPQRSPVLTLTAAHLGLFVGLLGGVPAETIGWRWILWVNVPIGVLALIMSVSHLPDSRDPGAARLDLPGLDRAAAPPRRRIGPGGSGPFPGRGLAAPP
ncbi:hypothetical protein [Mycolicibacterium nivoides]|uniref:hypothetical protein n=1 Tax=Mycolicibacterium nivoides TaxID=2487344 RepID=UPI0008EAC772|nr:hypothetical protein [Mycolicibacterium nivoides]SFF36822.1 hypothetical protein SAMN04488582_10298 [Mycobacterium sp. 455mf]